MRTRLIPTARLIFLLALGLVPMALAAQVPEVRWPVFAYDLGVLLLAALDFRLAPDARIFGITRRVAPRLAMGEREPVTIQARNAGPRALVVQVRDEVPEASRPRGGCSRSTSRPALTPRARTG